MGKKDPRVDAYIGKSADFARPILTHLRKLVHDACPDVEETMKWSFPHFEHEGVLCSMASFKAHCAFGFWKGALVLDTAKNRGSEAMGQFGRIQRLSDLPADAAIKRWVKKAAKLNEDGVKSSRPKRSARPREVAVPADLMAELRKNKRALATFDSFSPSHKREYVEWITEAKTDATRRRRLDTAVEWMSEGKARNWKYVR